MLHYRELKAPLNVDDLHTLRQMRLASGTYYDRIPTWLQELQAGTRLMWFVYLCRPPSPPTSVVPIAPPSPVSPTSLSFILNTPPRSQPSELPSQWTAPDTPPIAMVCLLKLNPQDMTLASLESHRYELTSLWIYPFYRALGVGAAVVAEMERQAALRGAAYLTFNTTACASHLLRTFSRMGYKEYKPREHRYSVNDVLNAGLSGESTLAAFFEKRVDGKDGVHINVS